MKGENTEKTAALKEQAKKKFCVCAGVGGAVLGCYMLFSLWLQARKPRRHQVRTERSQGT